MFLLSYLLLDTGDGQSSLNQPKLDRMKQGVSKLENNVLLSVKEDLKESMFMNPEPEQRESLLSPTTTKTRKVTDGRKIQNKVHVSFPAERMVDKQLSTSSEETDETSKAGDDISQSNMSISTRHVSISSKLRRTKNSAIHSRAIQSAAAKIQLSYSGNSASRVHSSMASGVARSRELLSGVSSPQRPQVVLDCQSELNDIRLLTEDFLVR